MRIYSKTNSSHGYFQNQYFRDLKLARLETDSVYWYDCHDFVVRATHLRDSLEERHWEHLRNDPTAKLVFFQADEYCNYFDVKMWVEVLKEKQIPSSKTYFVFCDENWVKWFDHTMTKLEYTGYHICHLPILMFLCLPQEKKPIETRFSLLSRNYQRWRLSFFIKLLDKDLLKDIKYTFHNIDPYGDIRTFSHDQLVLDAQGLGHALDGKALNWIYNIPYSLDVDVRSKFNDISYGVIQQSGINITVESQCDPHFVFPQYKHMHSKDFSVGFPTEKTYKAIACARPFITVSSPYFLEELRQLGFKTFHPYIDESYDLVYDMGERHDAIVREVERISRLSDSEFQKLMEQLQPIADHNLSVLESRRSIELTDDFKFLRDIKDTRFLFRWMNPVTFEPKR